MREQLAAAESSAIVSFPPHHSLPGNAFESQAYIATSRRSPTGSAKLQRVALTSIHPGLAGTSPRREEGKLKHVYAGEMRRLHHLCVDLLHERLLDGGHPPAAKPQSLDAHMGALAHGASMLLAHLAGVHQEWLHNGSDPALVDEAVQIRCRICSMGWGRAVVPHCHAVLAMLGSIVSPHTV